MILYEHRLVLYKLPEGGVDGGFELTARVSLIPWSIFHQILPSTDLIAEFRFHVISLDLPPDQRKAFLKSGA